MLSIHPEVKDFGDEDETNYETDKINKEKMKEFCIFIADHKSPGLLKGLQARRIKGLLRPSHGASRDGWEDKKRKVNWGTENVIKLFQREKET